MAGIQRTATRDDEYLGPVPSRPVRWVACKVQIRDSKKTAGVARENLRKHNIASPADAHAAVHRIAGAGETRRSLPDMATIFSLGSPKRQEEISVSPRPAACPGCGAPSQTVDATAAGFYALEAQNKRRDADKRRQLEDAIFHNAIHKLGPGPAIPIPVAGSLLSGENGEMAELVGAHTQHIPICARCHSLRHYSRGMSIVHPSMLSVQAIIDQSPHVHNHIYHVLDAADFPMSLIPNLQHALDLPRLRTQNRRSKTVRYMRGRVAEVSFIITRSDLLAPKKEQVDTLMPYLQHVLRDALGRNGRNLRLGNVACVSAKRGWWTKKVKEDIWARGGAGWMVGKVNVGKSALFDVVFPKGRSQPDPSNQKPTMDALSVLEAQSPRSIDQDEEDALLDESEDSSLLPAARAETAYPVMPLVSSLPGTTASPIRIPFGGGKGELIDLPGVHRSSLDEYVRREFRTEMVMKQRVVPEGHTIKPGQSLLLGGLIRITPRTEDEGLIVMAYPFLPPAFDSHVTGTHKAIAIQTGVHSPLSRGLEGEGYTGTVESIATADAKEAIKSAGVFQLDWDVTKRRAGPLTDHAAGKQKAENLPFIVYSTDILIEGVGWVELVCQVRRRSDSLLARDDTDVTGAGGMDVRHQIAAPEVEIFTPEGKFVGHRRPMNAWLLGGKKKVPVHQRRARPRQAIGMSKRRDASRTNLRPNL